MPLPTPTTVRLATSSASVYVVRYGDVGDVVTLVLRIDGETGDIHDAYTCVYGPDVLFVNLPV